MRLLLDSNIVFSAVISDGNERFLVAKSISSHHLLVITDLIVEEINRVIQRKVSLKKRNEVFKIFGEILQSGFIYIKRKEQYQKFIPTAKQYINPKDAPILAAGLQPEIDIIVSGDKHFLKNKNLKKLRKNKIFTTREIIERL